jgi:GNAT superfamily N-acetyltransferase
MEIIKNPSREQLSSIQEVLQIDTGVGIVDIYGVLVTDYFVIIESEHPVGVASISRMGACAEIYKLYVIPSSRGKKYGKTLLDESINFLAESGVDEVFIDMVGSSHGFWEKATREYKLKEYGCGKFSIVING